LSSQGLGGSPQTKVPVWSRFGQSRNRSDPVWTGTPEQTRRNHANAESLPSVLLDRPGAGKKHVMNTRTIAIAALVIAVILLLLLFL
jgi:hypothetical protein